jgi:hypothetical protein
MICCNQSKQAALFEKSAQKLLPRWAMGVFNASVPFRKSFLVTFFQKSNFLLQAPKCAF